MPRYEKLRDSNALAELSRRLRQEGAHSPADAPQTVAHATPAEDSPVPEGAAAMQTGSQRFEDEAKMRQ